ncbi:MAG: leucine--tRNA ligase [Phycisphaerales bacterium]
MSIPAESQANNLGAGPSSDQPRFRYNAPLADAIETRWQQEWEARRTFVQPNPGESGFDASKPKFYCLDMFPYPSGAGLHVGHPEGYTATDILCRYKRMQGFNVLHPMGWDAFGLPAEQYAIQTGIHPAITTKQAIENFRRQLKRFGFSYDWTREFGTIDPGYYKWTQWIFLQLYGAWFDEGGAEGRSEEATKGREETAKGRARPIADLVMKLERGEMPPQVNPRAGEVEPLSPAPASWRDATPAQRRSVIDSYRLAYLGEQTVNWCPKLGTVLANDEVIEGRSERGGHPVLRKPLKQWTFRITAYAERLLGGLAKLDWPESTKAMQAEWIGRSEGAEVDFPLEGNQPLRVFTTRPDTIFGATYMVVAPEHPLVARALSSPTAQGQAAALREYVDRARRRSDVERMESKEKTGVFTGLHAINPATGERIPVWVADYVLMGYGHGAIMAVPAHDERDYDFAKAMGLPIRDVVYSRPHLAMAYFAAHAPAAARTPERWMGVLADFLGWVTTQNAGPDRFDEGLALIAGRRSGQADGTAVQIHGEPPADRPGSIGERRGVSNIVWLDAIEAMKFESIEEFTDRFDRAAVCDRAGEPYVDEGYAANSANAAVSINGLGTAGAKARTIEWLYAEGIGARRVNYRLRDWTFSRQRYWGEPFPIVFDAQGNHYAVRDSALPVVLPAMADYAPVESDDPMPLLAKATAWMNTTAGEAGVPADVLPPGTPVRREANTMPGSAGSSWYAIRYCDPKNTERFVGKEAERYWLGTEYAGVDQYLGGSEHAVGHLLYARFWHMVLHDLGHLSTVEPFQRLFHQGLITSFAYQRADKSLVATDLVEEVSEGKYVERATGQPVTQIVAKMSKSLKNVVNPDDIIREFGADTFRLYEMYMGPLEASKPWNTRDIVGLQRFLQRLWRVMINESTGELKSAPAAVEAVERQLHKTIAKVGPDIERLAFNTAIAALIEFVNVATKEAGEGAAAASLTRDQAERFAKLIAPFTPHVAEELWAKLGHSESIACAPWPVADAAKIAQETVEIAVQISGKVRAKVNVPAGADDQALEAAAMGDEKVKAMLEGKTVKKVIVVKGKLVNIVAV